jgi:hypothetical protein
MMMMMLALSWSAPCRAIKVLRTQLSVCHVISVINTDAAIMMKYYDLSYSFYFAPF